MKTADCAYQEMVLEASRSARWTETLQRHVAGCAECRETAGLAALLLDLSRETEKRAQTPSAERIWSMAQWRERDRPVHRALQPIVRMQRFALAFGGAAAVVAAAVGWEQVAPILRILVPSDSASAPAAALDPVAASALLSCFLLFQLACALYLSWVED